MSYIDDKVLHLERRARLLERDVKEIKNRLESKAFDKTLSGYAKNATNKLPELLKTFIASIKYIFCLKK